MSSLLQFGLLQWSIAAYLVESQILTNSRQSSWSRVLSTPDNRWDFGLNPDYASVYLLSIDVGLRSSVRLITTMDRNGPQRTATETDYD